MESAGDTIKDISNILQDFYFDFTEEEIGGFGSIHLYLGRKIANLFNLTDENWMKHTNPVSVWTGYPFP
jgi:hypothetical protein